MAPPQRHAHARRRHFRRPRRVRVRHRCLSRLRADVFDAVHVPKPDRSSRRLRTLRARRRQPRRGSGEAGSRLRSVVVRELEHEDGVRARDGVVGDGDARRQRGDDLGRRGKV